MQFVHNIVITTTGNQRSVKFTLLGEPVAQNGWRLRFRGVAAPVMYNLLSRRKRQVKLLMQAAFLQLEEATPLFNGTRINVSIQFQLRLASTGKDLDNMAKFLLDALEGSVYDNDKFIMDLHLSKASSPIPKTIVSISHA